MDDLPLWLQTKTQKNTNAGLTLAIGMVSVPPTVSSPKTTPIPWSSSVLPDEIRQQTAKWWIKVLNLNFCTWFFNSDFFWQVMIIENNKPIFEEFVRQTSVSRLSES